MKAMLLLTLTMLMPLVAKCDNDEEVLLSLKQGMWDPTGAIKDWVPGSNICNWTGIMCAPFHVGRVQSISLGNKGLHGTITPLLGRLQFLSVLNMELNSLTGSIPTSLENCSHLTNISLASNRITGTIPRSLYKIQNLQKLDLFDNQLEGKLPALLGNCTMLNYLSLGQNHLSGSIPPQLAQLENLQTLRLLTNNFVGSFPTFLTNCTQLRILSVRNNSLTGFIPKELDQLVNLQQLRLQSNLFQGTIPPHIGNMTSLFHLDMSSNRLTGNIPSTFGSLRNIQDMYLNNNSLTGRIPRELAANCQYLWTLDLSHNCLQGPLPDNIGDFQGLENLTLNDNMITGKIPDSLGKLHRLISLDLSYNMLTGNLPSALANLANLQLAFNLAHNSLDGTIPAWIGNFRMVQNISLQWNNFSGQIPTSLAQCMSLSLLNLAGNQLVGNIPERLGDFKFLEVLDLSSNQLGGTIPNSLASLRYLVSVNFSGNDLEGPVPSNGNFRLFDLASFEGNPGLCGTIVHRACGDGTRSSNGSSSNTMIVAAVGIAGFSLLVILIAIRLYIRCSDPQGRVPVDPTESVSTALVGPLHAFTPQELLDMTEDYNEDNLIGVGGFSRVYKGKSPVGLLHITEDCSGTGEVVAVKLLGMEKLDEAKKGFIAELQTLGRVRHKNLAKLLGYCWTRSIKALILEYMPNGSLEQHLKKNAKDKAMGWKIRFNIGLGVAQGMSYLHHEFDFPIIHCDLKPANVLLDSNFEAHVADFGISKIAGSNECASVSIFRGSLGYVPPEYAHSTHVSTKGDVYSYGMLLLEIVTGKSPTNEIFKHSGNLHEWVKNAFPSRLLEVLDPLLPAADSSAYYNEMTRVVQLALACTSYLPTSRPRMQEVLCTMTHIGDGVKLFPTLDLLVNSPSPYTGLLIQDPEINLISLTNICHPYGVAQLSSN